jgi:hypothetical protein
MDDGHGVWVVRTGEMVDVGETDLTPSSHLPEVAFTEQHARVKSRVGTLLCIG